MALLGGPGGIHRPIAPGFDPQIQIALSNGRIVSAPMGLWLCGLIQALTPDQLSQVITFIEMSEGKNLTVR